jgi:hypothetical protein
MFNNVRKAVWAFASLLVTNMVTDLMQNGKPIPDNWGDAGRWLGTIVLGTAAVYLSRPAKGAVTPQPIPDTLPPPIPPVGPATAQPPWLDS